MNEADLNQITDMATLFRLDRLFLLVLALLALVLVVKGITQVGDALYRRIPRRRILISQIATTLNFSIYIFGGPYIFYAILQPPREVMLAATGSIAVALGLSMKDLVASVIAGFILLFDRPFQVGDRVSFGDVYGEIESIGLRSVRLVTLDDNLVTIPNNRFMSDVVASGNAGALDMMLVFDFYIALDADIRLARDLLYEVVVTSRYAYLKKPVMIVMKEMPIAERLALQLKAKAYVIDVRFEKAFQTDVVLRATEAFNRHHVKRPPVGVGQFKSAI
ncbi:MAG: mechanosensitive ion channel family protein [Gammaproteobacteria bacterium]|nr:mechanosensitive ion channel family protein [Gammaproteobacteria bacterium]MBU1481489.1 mechanosensitive ion channel family protein [Gammaproteobacteria bacterium]